MLEEGVYHCQPNRDPRPIDRLPSDRPLLLYFDNRKCPFCRRFDEKWKSLVSLLTRRGDPLPVRVVCTFFHEDCRNSLARELFQKLGVGVTPLLVYLARGGWRRSLQPRRLWEMSVEDLLVLLRALSSL